MILFVDINSSMKSRAYVPGSVIDNNRSKNMSNNLNGWNRRPVSASTGRSPDRGGYMGVPSNALLRASGWTREAYNSLPTTDPRCDRNKRFMKGSNHKYELGSRSPGNMA